MNEQSPISAIYLATTGHFAVVITCYAPSYFITPDLLSIVRELADLYLHSPVVWGQASCSGLSTELAKTRSFQFPTQKHFNLFLPCGCIFSPLWQSV